MNRALIGALLFAFATCVGAVAPAQNVERVACEDDLSYTRTGDSIFAFDCRGRMVTLSTPGRTIDLYYLNEGVTTPYLARVNGGMWEDFGTLTREQFPNAKCDIDFSNNYKAACVDAMDAYWSLYGSAAGMYASISWETRQQCSDRCDFINAWAQVGCALIGAAFRSATVANRCMVSQTALWTACKVACNH